MALESYRDAVNYVESFIRGPAASLMSGDEQAALWRLRRASMEDLLSRMGDPQRRFRAVHVGGTSGKGSTCVLIASMLGDAGYRTGLHTTPYLQQPIEKIAVDGVPIPPQDLVGLVQRARPCILETARCYPESSPTYVQIWTALTFAYFAQREVDLGVVEVSLGGRFDSTNVLHPAVSVITSVGLDHTSSLGASLREIAWHKAGIVKDGTPVITGATQPEAIQAIEEECRKKSAPLYRVGRHLNYSIKRLDNAGALFDFQGLSADYRDLEIALLGEHQVQNACVALGAIDALRQCGVAVSEEAIRRGLREARVPGRLEVIQQRPLAILDGAHNPEKALSLRNALERLFAGRPLALVLGIGAAKDAAEILRPLVPLARLVICSAAGVVGKPAVSPEELAGMVTALGVEARVMPDPQQAVAAALDAVDPSGLVCVTGSLYLVGAARERWRPSDGILAEAAASASVVS